MISLLITLVVIGLILYLISTLPIAEPIKNIIYVVAVLLLIVWLLRAFGIADIPLR
jgi:hypothetical protein